MDQFALEWSLIKKNSIILLLLLVITGGVFWVTDYFISEIDRQLRITKNDLNQIKRRYRNTINDQALYSEYVERFKKMEDLGVVGGEKRLSWIETLQKLNGYLKLPMLKHKLFRQAQVLVEEEPDAPIPLSTLTLYKTDMYLEAGLFHELDLIKILKGLEKAKGLFNLRGCKLELVESKKVLSVKDANIQAECMLEWYSINVVENEEDDTF